MIQKTILSAGLCSDPKVYPLKCFISSRSIVLTDSPIFFRHVQKNITLPDTNSHDSFTIVHSDTFIIDVKEISPAQVATLGGFNSGDIHDFKHRWIHLLILLVNRSAQWNGDNLVISTVLRT